MRGGQSTKRKPARRSSTPPRPVVSAPEPDDQRPGVMHGHHVHHDLATTRRILVSRPAHRNRRLPIENPRMGVGPWKRRIHQSPTDVATITSHRSGTASGGQVRTGSVTGAYPTLRITHPDGHLRGTDLPRQIEGRAVRAATHFPLRTGQPHRKCAIGCGECPVGRWRRGGDRGRRCAGPGRGRGSGFWPWTGQ